MKVKFRTYFIICIAVILVFMLNSKSIFATENVILDYKKVDVQLDKQWTVHFNSKINKDCVNNANFTVISNSGQVINAEAVLGADSKAVVIKPPKEAYEVGGIYYLKISNVYSTDNKKINKTVTMKFYIICEDENEKLLQFQPPKVGEEIAIITTNKGYFKIKFFDKEAPKAVENFKTHIKQGYYNGLIFHRVMPEFMIQGGDPLGNGKGGESIWAKPFQDEFTPSLHNFRGALSMANAGPNTNGSQFFIVQKSSLETKWINALKNSNSESYPKDVVEKYEKIAGTPYLDYKHTVFGQVFQGMDIVDDISNVETTINDKPLEAIVIKSVELTYYKK